MIAYFFTDGRCALVAQRDDLLERENKLDLASLLEVKTESLEHKDAARVLLALHSLEINSSNPTNDSFLELLLAKAFHAGRVCERRGSAL